MSNNRENLEGLVYKLKEQGISAGTQEKNRIIDQAKEEASAIIADAEKRRTELIEEAERKAAKFQETAQISIAQASRDMILATRMAVINYLKTIFRKQADSLFTQEQYRKELLKAVIEAIPGNKTISLNKDVLKEMEAFLLKEALNDKIILQPLGENATKIVVESSDNGSVQFVLSSKDVEEGLFSLLNKELVESIIKGREES